VPMVWVAESKEVLDGIRKTIGEKGEYMEG
jgi:hypothetical protein